MLTGHAESFVSLRTGSEQREGINSAQHLKNEMLRLRLSLTTPRTPLSRALAPLNFRIAVGVQNDMVKNHFLLLFLMQEYLCEVRGYVIS